MEPPDSVVSSSLALCMDRGDSAARSVPSGLTGLLGCPTLDFDTFALWASVSCSAYVAVGLVGL